MSTVKGPGSTRSANGGSHFERVTRLQAARREVIRLTRWIRVTACAFVVGFGLAVMLWLIR